MGDRSSVWESEGDAVKDKHVRFYTRYMSKCIMHLPQKSGVFGIAMTLTLTSDLENLFSNAHSYSYPSVTEINPQSRLYGNIASREKM